MAKRKKRDTTKRLPASELKKLKHDLRHEGHLSHSVIAKKYGVTPSTVAYHAAQIKKSDDMDAMIEAHENGSIYSQGARPAGIESPVAIAYKQEVSNNTQYGVEAGAMITRLEETKHALTNQVQRMGLERDILNRKIVDLQAFIADILLKHKGVLI